MVTALLLSAAMAGGGMPRMVPVEAVHAVLGAGRAPAMPREIRSTSEAISATRVDRPLGTVASVEFGDRGEHARFLAVAPSGPARGDLPPPGA